MKLRRSYPAHFFSGSVGDAISLLTPDVYVSDDGGYSWQLALKGPHHYAILDSGGLLVAVEHNQAKPISEIKWASFSSWDETHTVRFYTAGFPR